MVVTAELLVLLVARAVDLRPDAFFAAVFPPLFFAALLFFADPLRAEADRVDVVVRFFEDDAFFAGAFLDEAFFDEAFFDEAFFDDVVFFEEVFFAAFFEPEETARDFAAADFFDDFFEDAEAFFAPVLRLLDDLAPRSFTLARSTSFEKRLRPS